MSTIHNASISSGSVRKCPELHSGSILGKAIASMCAASRGTPLMRCLRFLRSERHTALNSSIPLDAYATSKGDSLLPSHLPIAPDYLFGGRGTKPKSARSRARLSAKRTAWLLTEITITSFGFWELDCPKSMNQLTTGFGNYKVTARQTQAFWNLFHENLKISRLNPGDLQGAGRGQKVLSTLIDIFERKHCKQKHEVQSVLNTAMYVDPERVSLPSQAATVDPADILPEDRARAF